jgi:Family of unknown function (DUF5719)
VSPGKRRREAEVARRQRTRRFDLVTVLAVLIPLVTVGLLALVQRPPAHDTTQPPTLTRLTGATVVCPAAVPGSQDAVVSTAGGASGNVTVLSDGASRPVHVATGASSRLPGKGSQVVKGADALAPGLLGLRAGTSPLTVDDCGVPAPDQWFTGLGARADHDSVIELVNPDAGPANVDITLYGKGPFSTRRLRGLTVPGHKTLSLDLGTVVPRRPLLSAQVQVSRGRLAVHVLDSFTDLRTHRVQREWLPAQSAPAVSSEMLGLPTGHGTRTLQLANPGDGVVRAQVKIVTGDTAFAPKGLDRVTIPPGATTAVPLTRVLGQALGDGAVGVAVRADGPVTSSLLTSLDADRVLTVPDDAVREEAATLLPVTTGKGARPARPTLYLSADSAGAAVVTAYDASGKRVLHRRVGQQQGHTVAVALPRGSAFLQVVPQRTVVRGAVLLSGDGASVVPLHELLTQGLVPQISPGLD